MDTSDWIALAAIGVAVLAAIPGFVSLCRAKQSNSIAQDAVKEAHEANTIASKAHALSTKAEARATELNVVEFVFSWEPNGHLMVRNIGTGTAVDLAGYCTIRDERADLDPATLGPNEHLSLAFPETLKAAQNHMARQEHFYAEHGPGGSHPGRVVAFGFAKPMSAEATVLLGWRSPEGTPASYGPVQEKLILKVK